MSQEDRQQPDDFIVVKLGPEPLTLTVEPAVDDAEDPAFDPYSDAG
jgi:hypothetical protein